MRPKSIALLAVALGCGLLASIGITQVLAKRSSEPVETSIEMENVFVALQDIPAGEPLHPEMAKLEPWPKGKVPPNTLTKGDDLTQYTTKTKFYSGEPLIKNKLHAKGDKSDKATDNIPKGMRVVSVKVDRVSGTASLIEPGDCVDLLCHFQPNAAVGIAVPTTRTVLQNLKVFAVDQVISTERADDGKPVQAQTVSFVVTPDRAQRVTLASEMGTLRLVLRPPGDADDLVTNAVTAQNLFNGTDGDKPEKDANHADDGKAIATPEFLKVLKETLSKADSTEMAPAAAPLTEQYVVRRLTGDKYTELLFEKTRDADGNEVWKPAGENDLASGPPSAAPTASPTTAAPESPPTTEAPARPPKPSRRQGGPAID